MVSFSILKNEESSTFTYDKFFGNSVMLLSYKGGKLLCYLTLLYISRLIEVHRRLH